MLIGGFKGSERVLRRHSTDARLAVQDTRQMSSQDNRVTRIEAKLDIR